MNVWTIAPPAQPNYITKIVELDFNVFDGGYICAAADIGTVTMAGEIARTENRASFGPEFRYVVYFHDGQIARATAQLVNRAMDALGQDWEEPE